MLFFLLAQTTQPPPEQWELYCSSQPECIELHYFSKLHVEQMVAWSKGTDPSVQRTLTCREALKSCLEHELGPGRLYRQSEQGLYVLPAGTERIRVITFQERVQPSPNGYMWTNQEAVVVDVLSDRVLEMPTPELALSGPQLRGAWDESTPHPDYSVTALNSKRVSTHRPFERSPYVVCADRVVQQPLALRAIGVREVGFNQEGFQTVYEYELPCKAELLIGGALPFIQVGPRQPSPYGSPPRAESANEVNFHAQLGALSISATSVLQEQRSALSGVSGCELQVNGLEIQSSNRCSVLFIGDVNADGHEDYVFEHSGEMGCGWRELWTTENGGLRRVSVNSWDC